MEIQAEIGAVIILILLILLGIGLMRANVITGAFMRTARQGVRTRFLVALGIAAAVVLLLYGVAQYGMVNSLPAEKHVERNRDSNRLVITEDKDGCLDMRTLGRSNGVYMAVQPCKPGDKDKKQAPPAQQKPQ